MNPLFKSGDMITASCAEKSWYVWVKGNVGNSKVDNRVVLAIAASPTELSVAAILERYNNLIKNLFVVCNYFPFLNLFVASLFLFGIPILVGAIIFL